MCTVIALPPCQNAAALGLKKNVEMSFCQWCPLQGQRYWAQTGAQEGPSEHQAAFLCCAGSGALAQDAQGGSGGSSLEIFKKTSGHGLVQAALGVSDRDGPGGPRGAFQPQPLWFHDFVKWEGCLTMDSNAAWKFKTDIFIPVMIIMRFRVQRDVLVAWNLAMAHHWPFLLFLLMGSLVCSASQLQLASLIKQPLALLWNDVSKVISQLLRDCVWQNKQTSMYITLNIHVKSHLAWLVRWLSVLLNKCPQTKDSDTLHTPRPFIAVIYSH